MFIGFIWLHIKNKDDENYTTSDEHFDKHVTKQKEFGNISKDKYLEKAQDIIGSETALSKKRANGSRVFYEESSNEFGVLSDDGYIQTFFKPTTGIKYYNSQK